MRVFLYYVLWCVPACAFWRGFINNLPLKNIVASNAILSTVTSQMNIEFINESVLFSEIANFRIHPQTSMFYLTSFITVAAIHHYLFTGKQAKWSEIGGYSEIQKITGRVLFICLIVFTKGIENAI